jgi:hypothetical protein
MSSMPWTETMPSRTENQAPAPASVAGASAGVLPWGREASLLLALLFAAAAVGWADYRLGYELSLSPLYLAPIACASWFAGRRSGLGLAVLSTGIWMAVHVVAEAPFSRPWLLYWNAGGRLVFFAAAALAMSEIRKRLDSALNQVRELSRLLPICASCKNIRDDEGRWTAIETFFAEHADAQFSHGICPSCMRQLYPELDPASPASPRDSGD